jgi:hypothetical protein
MSARGLFNSIKDKVTGSESVEDLCQCLVQWGINASVLDKNSPEVLPVNKVFGIATDPPIGTIKVEGKNFDLIELHHRVVAKSSGMTIGGVITIKSNDNQAPQDLLQKYIIRTDTSLGRDLKVELKAKEKGFMNKEIVGYEWKGGKLAQALNSDAELEKMLMSVYEKADIKVDVNEKFNYIMISGDNRRKGRSVGLNIGGINTSTIMDVTKKVTEGEDLLKMWKESFPTLQELQVYDRIAGDARTVARR